MRLQFKSIRIIRFRSFLNEAILHFDDASPGLYFLKGINKTNNLGSNGSGKSTIVDALMWCLYGKTVQGLKNPDIIPWTGKGQTEVEVTIFIDKVKRVITRTANKNLLMIDGKEVGQQYVNELISIPFEIIPYTIILGQRQPLFFDLTASEKLKLFSEVLQLERWENRSQHASELTKSLEREITSKEAELEASLNAQSQASSDFNNLKQLSSRWEQERASKLANAERDKNDLQKKINEVSNERDSADLQLDRSLTELKALKPILEKCHHEENILSRKVQQLSDKKLGAINKREELQKMLLLVNDKQCPTCKQSLKSQKEIKELRNDIECQIKDLEIDKTTIELKNAILEQDKINEQVDIQEKAKEEFEHDAEQAQNILDRLQPKIAGWQAEIKAIDKELSERSESDNPYDQQLQALRRRRDQVKATIIQAQEIIKTKSEYCERVRFWVKGFKDCKLLQVEEILQELDIVTNGLIEEFGLVGWQVKYDIERETKQKTISKGLNITVLSPHNKNAVKWESWSGGEAQRLRIIGTEALSSVLLNNVGISTNLTIYDEPTTGLSKEGIQDLVDLLSNRAKDSKKNIWLVDQHAVESSHFIQTMLVTKDKKGSSLSAL